MLSVRYNGYMKSHSAIRGVAKTTFIVLLALAFDFKSNAAPRSGTLTLRSGVDKITGMMLGYDAKDGFLWRHPAIAGEMRIDGADVRKLSFAAIGMVKGARVHTARVAMVNGDEIAGELSALDENTLTLDTWYAGQLRIPRAAIVHLVPGALSKVVFEGPDSLRGWGAAVMGVYLGDDGELFGGVTVERTVEGSPAEKAGLMAGDIITAINGKPFKVRAKLIRFVKGHEPGDKMEVAIKRLNKEMKINLALASIHWKFDEGTLVTNGTGGIIGREFDWPARANVEFDLAWPTTLGIDIILCADQLYTLSYVNAYAIRLNSSYAYLYRYTSDGKNFQTSSLGSIQIMRHIAGKKKGRFSICMDKKKKEITLMFEGKLIKKWREPAVWAAKGRALQFNPQTSNAMGISNIRVSEWDGRLPNQIINASGGDGKQDFVRLANDDTISGEIGRIAAGKLSVKMSFTEKPIDVPLARVGLVKFGRKSNIATAPLPEVIPVGKVMEVDREKQSVGFEVFARGAAKIGEELEIHRGDKLIGQVKVEKAEDDAILPAEILAEAEAIKVGDIVVRPALIDSQKPLSEATAYLTQRGRITFRLHAWQGNRVIVTHPYIGTMSMIPAALSSLQFK